SRRLLHASGGSQILSRGRSAAAPAIRGSGRLDTQSDLECGRLRKVFQRPNDWRICSRHLEGEAVSGGVKQQRTENSNVEIRNSKKIQMTKNKRNSKQIFSDFVWGFEILRL